MPGQAARAVRTGQGGQLLEELVNGDRQTIAFLDPKGMRNLTDNFNNPKVRMAREIKELERDLAKKADVRLESYLISQTHRDKLRWPSVDGSGRDARLEEYRAHHILMAKLTLGHAGKSKIQGWSDCLGRRVLLVGPGGPADGSRTEPEPARSGW